MSAMNKWLGSGIAGLVLIAGAAGVTGQDKPKSAAASPAAPAQKTFDSPKAAAEALVAAASSDDIAALKAILGPDGKSLVETSDAVQTKNQLEGFAAQAQKNTAVVLDPKNPDRATL